MNDTPTPYRSPSLTDEGLDLTPRRASNPTPPAAPDDPSNRAPASGVVPSGGASDDGQEVDDGLAADWRWYGEHDWSQRPAQPRQWLLTRPADPMDDTALPKGFLPLSKVGLLAAAGGVGKTMALLQLAVSVVTGCEWLGPKGFPVPPESRGKVCLLLAEEDADEVQRRLTAIKVGMSLGADQWEAVRDGLLVLPYAGKSAQLIGTTGGRVETTEFFERFRRRLDGSGVDWRLVVLDPLSRLVTEQTETDNHHATRFVAAVEQLTQVRGGPTVLLAHHTSKAARGGVGADTANAARGASGLSDAVRWQANLARSPHEDDPKSAPALRLFLTKSNYGPPAVSRVVERRTDGVLFAAAAELPKATPVKERKMKSDRDGSTAADTEWSDAEGPPDRGI